MKKIYATVILTLTALAASTSAMALESYTMGNFTINPADGSSVKEIETITVTFNGLADGIDQHILPSNAGNYISITCGDKVYKPIEFKAGTGASIDDLVLKFPKITQAGTYTLSIAEGVVKDYMQAETADEGEGYSVNGPITATYTIAQTYMNVWELDPADGSSVKSISSITLAFPLTANRDGIDEYSNAENAITLTCGETVVHPASSEILSDYYTVRLTFEPAITAAGTYELRIPAEVYKEFDTFENESVNPEITATYTISSITGIDSASTAADVQKSVTVVDLLGRTVIKNAQAGAEKALQPGFYIINGKKTLIRK